MEYAQHPDYVERYLYSLCIPNMDYMIEMDGLITRYNNEGLLNNIDTLKNLIFEISNYNDNILVNLCFFVDRLQFNDIVKEDIKTAILETELNSDNVFEIYIAYVQYLPVMPVG
jgi:predicted Ser/Thr protein kinase